MSSAFDILKARNSTRINQAQLQDQRRRMNQQPAISEAKETAEVGVSLPPIGVMVEWAGANEPKDGRWVFCDGRLLQRAAYPDLFEVVGVTFNTGGELASEFRVPDRRGRVGMGAGQGSGLTNRNLGERLGVEQHALTLTQSPVHAHGSSTGSVTFIHSHGGGTGTVQHIHDHGYDRVTSLNSISGLAGGGSNSAVTGVNLSFRATSNNDFTHNHSIGSIEQTHGHSIGDTGGGDFHPNVQPSLVVNYIIRALP